MMMFSRVVSILRSHRWVKCWGVPCTAQVKWGQGKSGDSAKRSLAKAVLWRVFAASNTLICGVFLARDLSVASKIAGTDTVFKTVSHPEERHVIPPRMCLVEA